MEHKTVLDKLEMIRINKSYEKNRMTYILQNDKSDAYIGRISEHLDNLKRLEAEEKIYSDLLVEV
jgi:hypothetical protein